MNTISLNKGWHGYFTHKGEAVCYATEIPTSSIADLIKIGRLPEDIFYRDNYKFCKEFENTDFTYSLEFELDKLAKKYALCFGRIDTYATVLLNGEPVASTANGNIEHRFDVTKFLREGANELTVLLRSPVKEVEGLPARNGAFTTERLYTRRMQCSYGWDWVARFVSVGLGEVTLCEYGENDIPMSDVYVYTDGYTDESATVRVILNFEDLYKGRVLDINITAPSGKVVAKRSFYCKEAIYPTFLTVPSPMLWYPAGYGEQPLYTLNIYDGEELVYSHIFGIRSVRIEEIPDKKGSPEYLKCLALKNKDYDFNTEFSSFALIVNGIRINCMGANWVPSLPYIDKPDESKITETLTLAKNAGVNMIRVWGGGAFESRHFYSECSRLGITVTQDFLMACGGYPEEDADFIASLKEEAEYATKLIRNYPCLVWWSGDNENAVDGKETDENYQGRESALAGLSPIVYKNDFSRVFLPSSPYGGNKFASNTCGTTHNTQFLGESFKYFLSGNHKAYKEFFKTCRARFIAEEPQLGASPLSSLLRIMEKEDVFSESDEQWLHHTQSNPALPHELFDYLKGFTRGVLGEFTSPEDRLFKLQYMQYEWIRYTLEQERREIGFCNGIIYWMLNDCWPTAAGWSIIDYYNKPKCGYYAFKHASKPLSVSIDRVGRKYKVYVSNISLKDEEVGGVIKIINKQRTTVVGCCYFSTLCKSKSVSVPYELELGSLGENEAIVAEIYGHFGNDRTYYKEGALALKPATADYSVDYERGIIKFESLHYVHAVMLDGDILPEDNCFSLLPGEIREVKFESKEKQPQISVQFYTLE